MEDTGMEVRIISEVGRMTHLLLKRPEDAFLNQENLNQHWREYGYLGPPDFKQACSEYDAFAALLDESVPNLRYLAAGAETGLDSLYVRDCLLILEGGAVLLNMGKSLRRGEPQAAARFLSEAGIPILGEIRDPGRIEGGDVVWFDRNTLAVGQGYRTNADGIRQLAGILPDTVSDIRIVPLLHWKGPGDVLHLMSLISPLDHDLALVYSPLLPVVFREWLCGRGITLLEVPSGEYDSMAGNVLAVGPRDCLMLSGNPLTRGLLEGSGVRVREYDGTNISRLGAGGPTCLTRPLFRLD
jgi:N-dimethylarginine dimethylaminohydrolase